MIWRKVFFLPLFLFLLTSCAEDENSVFNFYEEPEKEILWSQFDPFCDYLVIVGDVQEYVAKKAFLPYFTTSMGWVANEAGKGAPLKGMIFVGDCTDNNSKQQWKTFRETASIAASVVPTIVVAGNHDYDWRRKGARHNAIDDRNSCLLTRYCDFPGVEDNIVRAYEPGRLENLIVRLTINSSKLYIVALEFSPRPEVLDWAAEFISSHPLDKIIVVTHEMLDSTGHLITNGGFGKKQFEPSGQGYSSPDEVWEALGYNYPNVKAFLCGHNAFNLHRELVRADGGKTPVILFNLQYQPQGGTGLLELWKFDWMKDIVSVQIMSTITGEIIDEPLSFPY